MEGHLWVLDGYTWVDLGALKGPQGDPGRTGCHERVFTSYNNNMTYRNDENNTSITGIRYVDFMAVEDNNNASGYAVYMCKETHVAAASWEQDAGYWEQVSINAASAYFNFLIARNANIKMLSSAKFTIADTNGTDVAGLANDNFPLWVGNATAANAPFRVNRSGELWATNAHLTGTLTLPADGGAIDFIEAGQSMLKIAPSSTNIIEASREDYIFNPENPNDKYKRYAGLYIQRLAADTPEEEDMYRGLYIDAEVEICGRTELLRPTRHNGTINDSYDALIVEGIDNRYVTSTRGIRNYGYRQRYIKYYDDTVGNNYTATEDADVIIVTKSGVSDKFITLPQGVEPGREIWVMNLESSSPVNVGVVGNQTLNGVRNGSIPVAQSFTVHVFLYIELDRWIHSQF